MILDWKQVSEKILEKVDKLGSKLLYGQDRAAKALALRLTGQPGIILADEVGLGKTRIALLAMDAVLECGGNAAVVVPAGLLFQWENEYKEYKKTLEESTSTAVKMRSFSDLFDHGDLLSRDGCGFPLANSEQRRWVLISHAFGFHRVTESSPAWRVELPALVRAAYEFEKPYRNKWREYAMKCEYHKTSAESWYGQYWAAAKYLAKMLSDNKLSSDSMKFLLDGDVRPNNDASGRCSKSLIELFRKGGLGYAVMLELIGYLIGPIDMLIIDEAHKSRDDTKSPEKQLGILVEKIVKGTINSRRISLTATPIELGAYQWKDILSRTNIEVDTSVIDTFAENLEKARVLPTSPEMIDRLIKSAIDFETALSNFVIRRRRINQKEMQFYFDGPMKEANPHRKQVKVPISFSYLSERWRRAVLSLEGQGLAGKGLSVLSMRERLIDTRYASGLMTFDVSDDYAEQNIESDQANSKMNRFIFWKKAACLLAGKEDGSSGLMEHPRIQAAADHIELNLNLADGSRENREKYLVFGRFTAPMTALRKELNARYVLRCIDLGRPVLGGKIDHETIFSCYRRLNAIADDKSPLREPLAFRGSLSKGGYPDRILNLDALSALIDTAVDRHRNDREYVAKILDQEFLRNKLPGDAVIKKLTPNQQDALFSLLRLEVFTELFHDESFGSIEGSKAEEIRSRAVAIWSKYLEGVIDGTEEGFLTNYERTGWKGEIHYEKLDSLGDCVDPVHLVLSLGLDDADSRESSFCRMLDGSTPPATRKVLQAQFNSMVYPRVLITQSLVGREGLNLHKKCRRVLLFHPEWNPAIVEQQIGRVDRINSLWTAMADAWHDDGRRGELPKIKVEYMVFEKTYDDYQFQVLESRRKSMNAQLFGELLDGDTLAKVPKEKIDELLKASPNFEPGD